MGEPLIRPNRDHRLFPAIHPTPYLPATDGAPTRGARAILDLSAAEGLTRLQRLVGVRLSPLDRIRRLLLFHRLACEAEAAGETVRADFFWARFHDLLPGVMEDPRCGGALARAAAGEDATTPLGLWEQLVDEVFIDTHLGFHNGRTAGGCAPDDRALLHMGYAQRLLHWSGMTPEERLEMDAALTRQRVEHDLAAGRSEDARVVCMQAMQRLPHNAALRELWVDCVRRDALAAVDPRRPQPSAPGAVTLFGVLGTILRVIFWLVTPWVTAVQSLWHSQESGRPAGAAMDAITLLRAIGALDQFRRRHPDVEAIDPALAELYAALAVRQAGSGNLPEALVSARRAMAHAPDWDDARALADRLTGEMQVLRERVQRMEAQMQRNPDVLVGAGVRAMRDQAHRGFRSLETYLRSGEEDRIQAARRLATGLRLWQTLGLPEADTDPGAHALALVDAMERVLADPPAEPSDLAGAWARAASGDPVLAACDAGPILRLLRQRLFGDAAETAPPPAPEPPRLASGRGRSRRAEPFGYWLFAPGQVRLKAQAATAVLLLLAFGAVRVRESVHLARRDATYREALAARDAGDDLRLMTAAERFLETPILASDDRDDRVEEMFSEAVVRTALDDGYPEAQLRPHANRYRELVNPDREEAR